MNKTWSLKDAENNNVKTYWWNVGSKKKDFDGSYGEWIKNHNVKISLVKHPVKSVKVTGLRARIPVGSIILTYDDFNYDYPKLANKYQKEQAYLRFLDMVIVFALTYLGDKAILEGRYKDYKINWR